MELVIYDRHYDKWCYKIDNKECECAVNPTEFKLFHGDVINELIINELIINELIINELIINEPASTILSPSPYRRNETIPGILIVNGNTYGRINDNKLLYKCIPNDKCLPAFLIPYENKCKDFNKNKINKYITFKIKSWQDKHPLGILTNTLGDVDKSDHFYQYQLICKGLNQSIASFTKATKDIKKSIISPNNAAEYRRDYHIFSIDPPGSKDIDDAISIKTDGTNTVISIYIANVPMLLESLQLWTHFGDRISTIYLPNGKHPMLPLVLSDDLCSLLQKKERYAFCMDIHLHNNAVINIICKPLLITVSTNYAYEETALLANEDYIRLFQITKDLNMQYKYVDTINDSHDVVEFYMIFMNYNCSKKLLKENTGIFRSTNINQLPRELDRVVNTHNAISSHYCNVANATAHELIGQGLSSYVHITSPIRRLVDLINLIELQKEYMSEHAKTFSNYWLEKIEYINVTMKNIRKVQNTCTLLDLYLKDSTKSYTGVVFNKCITTEFKYSLYISCLNLITTLKTTVSLDDYTSVTVKPYIFKDEDCLMRKVRFQIYND